jgi:hypothetical protein
LFAENQAVLVNLMKLPHVSCFQFVLSSTFEVLYLKSQNTWKIRAHLLLEYVANTQVITKVIISLAETSFDSDED